VFNLDYYENLTVNDFVGKAEAAGHNDRLLFSLEKGNVRNFVDA